MATHVGSEHASIRHGLHGPSMIASLSIGCLRLPRCQCSPRGDWLGDCGSAIPSLAKVSAFCSPCSVLPWYSVDPTFCVDTSCTAASRSAAALWPACRSCVVGLMLVGLPLLDLRSPDCAARGDCCSWLGVVRPPLLDRRSLHRRQIAAHSPTRGPAARGSAARGPAARVIAACASMQGGSTCRRGSACLAGSCRACRLGRVV